MIGSRLLPMFSRPSKELVERFQDIATPLISDCMNRLYGTSELTPFHRTKKLLGVAYTVKTRPSDNLLIHKAISSAEPGDVIVVDGGGEVTNALVGELMKLHAEYRGLGGFVIDGAIRDMEAFAETDFPCFARGVSHRGPYKDGPGEIGIPVVIGRLIVRHGDIIVGDEDGLITVRPDEADELVSLVTKKLSQEKTWKEEVLAQGEDTTWVDEVLAAKGVKVS